MQEFLPGKVIRKWSCEHSASRVVASDGIGVVALGGLILLLALALKGVGPSLLDWLVIYFGLSVVSVGSWHVDSAPRTTSYHFLLGALGSVGIGAASFLIDLVLGHIWHPEMTLLAAATAAPGPFGYVLTLIICPGTTLMSLAGAARTAFLHREDGCGA